MSVIIALLMAWFGYTCDFAELSSEDQAELQRLEASGEIWTLEEKGG